MYPIVACKNEVQTVDLLGSVFSHRYATRIIILGQGSMAEGKRNGGGG